MGHLLTLPDGFDYPREVNGWRFDPDPYNGHAWVAPERDRTVLARTCLGTAMVKVHDERVSGPGSSVTVAEFEYDRGDSESAAARVVERAVDWMHDHAPTEWSHPEVTEAAFDAPPGYEFVDYSRGCRETCIYYRREGASGRTRVAGAGRPDEVTPETSPYLVVQMWQGSGNASVDLAPWRYEHDEERETVADPPAECGLDVALAVAREFAREIVAEDPDTALPSAGQTTFGDWGETA